MNRITEKQKEFARQVARNGGNGTKAALEAYDVNSIEAASVIATRNMKNPKVQNELEKELARQGITLDKSLKPISKGLVATKKDENGETVDDLDTQLKASDRALKLLLPKDKIGDFNFNLNIDSANFGGQFVGEADE